MSKTNGHDGAFSIPETQFSHFQPGLTKREYFAALALSGLIHDYNAIVDGNNTLAVVAVNLADRLIEELNR